jgi:hypothetical protein
MSRLRIDNLWRTLTLQVRLQCVLQCNLRYAQRFPPILRDNPDWHTKRSFVYPLQNDVEAALERSVSLVDPANEQDVTRTNNHLTRWFWSCL